MNTPNLTLARFSLAIATGLIAISATSSLASLPLETETARLSPVGRLTTSGAYEYQTSTEGHEAAIPFAFEYGLTDRIELLVEPVAYAAVRPKLGARATGVGDVEATAVYLVSHERGSLPAFAVAGEVKVPTARNNLLGTGATDFTGYLIGSHKLGRRFDTHANLAYTLVGQPAGVQLDNLVSYALAFEYEATPKLDLVSEVYGNTSATGEGQEAGTGGENAVIPEASGGETVGVVGFRYLAAPATTFSLGVSYDNNKAVVFSPGITRHFD
ncbi:MAG: transporter [Candidatus Eisenbacteria bacterium]